jgi:hypothetical protein
MSPTRTRADQAPSTAIHTPLTLDDVDRFNAIRARLQHRVVLLKLVLTHVLDEEASEDLSRRSSSRRSVAICRTAAGRCAGHYFSHAAIGANTGTGGSRRAACSASSVSSGNESG